MKLDNIYSSDLFDEVYGNLKYFNQHPWDVAMTKNLAAEFEYFKQTLSQDVINGVRDGNEYYALLKLALDGPIIYFDPVKEI